MKPLIAAAAALLTLAAVPATTPTAEAAPAQYRDRGDWRGDGPRYRDDRRRGWRGDRGWRGGRGYYRGPRYRRWRTVCRSTWRYGERVRRCWRVPVRRWR